MGLPSIRSNDPYASYGHRATSTAVPRLVGVNKTRAQAKERYTEIVAQLHVAATPAKLEQLLAALRPELLQFQSELEFLWEGEGDFTGLRKEIEAAHVRVDPGLDWPRHDPQAEEGTGEEDR